MSDAKTLRYARHVSILLAVFLLAFFPYAASRATGSFWGIQEQDRAAVPVYCKGKDSPQGTRWARYMERHKIPAPHHACYGLALLNVARRTYDKTWRNSILSEAVNSIADVLDRAPKETLVIPDLYVYRSDAYMMAGRKAEALADLEKALQLNPKHRRAYALLSDAYKDLGNKAKALEVAERGLKFFPTSKSLNRRHKKLGGENATRHAE